MFFTIAIIMFLIIMIILGISCLTILYISGGTRALNPDAICLLIGKKVEEA